MENWTGFYLIRSLTSLINFDIDFKSVPFLILCIFFSSALKEKKKQEENKEALAEREQIILKLQTERSRDRVAKGKLEDQVAEREKEIEKLKVKEEEKLWSDRTRGSLDKITEKDRNEVWIRNEMTSDNRGLLI